MPRAAGKTLTATLTPPSAAYSVLYLYNGSCVAIAYVTGGTGVVDIATNTNVGATSSTV